MRRERIVIWGVGNRLEYTYGLLNSEEAIEIVGLGDNDLRKQGTFYEGLKVLDLSEAIALEPDYIVISSMLRADEIYNNLVEVFGCPIYKCAEELIYKRASIDITDGCNARCKWCATGRGNLEKGIHIAHMSLETFKKIYYHMCETGLIHTYNEIMLYNWGEPFLNPEYLSILKFLHQNRQKFSLSTNASVVRLADAGDLYENCQTVVFSMCGYSQESYDRIHKFNFKQITKNIRELWSDMKKHGFKGKGIISYHIYKFNQEEMALAKEFAEELELEFEPVRAYFASYMLTKAYLCNELSTTDSESAEKELILDGVEELIKARPIDFRCLLENIISVHSDGRLELCCCCDKSVKNYFWNTIYEIKTYDDWHNYRQEMLECETCVECRTLGIDYWITK